MSYTVLVVRANKQSVIYRNFEYVKERENRCGTTSWRCQMFQSMQCKARFSGDRVISNRQPKHSELCEHVYVNSVKLMCLCYVFQNYEHSLNSIH